MNKFLEKTAVFFEMIKFEHSVFALPFAYAGLFLAARGIPDGVTFLLVTAAMISFRTFAMAVNRLFDREIDARNPRTAGRALPAGTLDAGTVIIACIAAVVVFFLTAWSLNPTCFRLSWIPVVLALVYPFTKRFTMAAHFVLGFILGIAPYGAWLAYHETFSWIPGFFTAGVTAWVAGFDIIYALQDEGFDREEKLHSIPARFGRTASLNMTAVLHLAAWLCWVAAGFCAGLGGFYFGGLVFAGLCLLRENLLIRKKGIMEVGQAFFTMNAAVSVSLLILLAVDLTKG